MPICRPPRRLPPLPTLTPVPRPAVRNPYKHETFCTNIRHPEDHDILRRQLFDVNMRLFRVNRRYRTMIIGICDYIAWNTVTPKVGYKVPHGFSGANAGIPFNIIAVKRKIAGVVTAVVMINPKITRMHGETIVSDSNCGSLMLPQPIKVMRRQYIDFNYFNINGEHVIEENCTREGGGLTIQHEVDHNIGILITDRAAPAQAATAVPNLAVPAPTQP